MKTKTNQNDKNKLGEIIKNKELTVKSYGGEEVKLKPVYMTYKVPDVIGGSALIPGLGFTAKMDVVEICLVKQSNSITVFYI